MYPKDLKQRLAKLRVSLQTVELADYGSMTSDAVMQGIDEMTLGLRPINENRGNGWLFAVPVGVRKSPSIAGSTGYGSTNFLHDTYKLYFKVPIGGQSLDIDAPVKYGDAVEIGQIVLNSWPVVNETLLKRGLEVALEHAFDGRTVIIGKGNTKVHGEERRKTQYSDIFLGAKYS